MKIKLASPSPKIIVPAEPRFIKPGSIEWLRENGVTQSILKKWRSECPTKARWILNGYKSEHGTYPLWFGSVFHGYMEEILSSVRDGWINSLEEIPFQKMQDLVRMKMDKEQGFTSASRIDKEYEKAHAVGLVLAKKYFDVWQADFFGPNKKTYVQIEDKFKVFPESLSGVPWTGRRDLVTEGPDGLYLEEFKTKANWDTANLSKMVYRELQVIVYMKSYEMEFGETLKGVYYNLAKRPGLKQKQLETLSAYATRCATEIDFEVDNYFAKIPIYIPKEYVDLQWEKALRDAEDFVKWYQSPAVQDSMYSENCVTNYGACEYLDMCTVGHDDRIKKHEIIYAELAAD